MAKKTGESAPRLTLETRSGVPLVGLDRAHTRNAVDEPITAVVQARPRVGYFMEPLTSARTQSDPEAKKRVQDFLEKRAAKVAAPKERTK